jgi:hypothetical protein
MLRSSSPFYLYHHDEGLCSFDKILKNALTRLRGRSHFGAAKARPSAFAEATADKPDTLSHPLRRRASAASPMGEGQG